LAHCREDAVLCSHSVRQGRKWIQGRATITHHLQHFRELHPRLKVVDYHVGSQFFIAILSDETGFVTFHIEPDAEGAVKRIIICPSIWSSLPFSQTQ
jgi:predicted methyltransferase